MANPVFARQERLQRWRFDHFLATRLLHFPSFSALIVRSDVAVQLIVAPDVSACTHAQILQPAPDV
jgi:hypothetical protein